MKNLSLVIFIGINTAFASIDTCNYDSPPKCTPLTSVVLEDGTSVHLVQKWVQGPKMNHFTASFCRRQVNIGFNTCRRPDCTSTPCLHGSTCIETRSSYQCNCVLGYYGSQCQHASLTTPISTIITTTPTTSAFTASSSMRSTSSPTFSPIVTSTSNAPQWTSYPGLDTDTIATTANDVTTDDPTIPTTNMPSQALIDMSSTSASLTTPISTIITTTPTTSAFTASSSMRSTSSPTFSPIVTSTSNAPQWTSYPGLDTDTIATTANYVTTDDPTIPTTNMPSQALIDGGSTSAPPSKAYGYSSPITDQTFEDARQACIAFEPTSSDSGLIEITDEAEKAIITDFVASTSISQEASLWIGCPKYLSGDPQHGFYCYHSNYRYSSNDNINIGYWDWDTNEPQKSGRRCMVLNLSTQKYRAEYCESAVAVALCEWTSQ